MANTNSITRVDTISEGGPSNNTAFEGIKHTVRVGMASLMLTGAHQAAADGTHALQTELVQQVVATETTTNQTTEGIQSLVGEEFHKKISEIPQSSLGSMFPILQLALALPEREDREFLIGEVIEFFYNPSDQNLQNMIGEFDYANIPLQPDSLNSINIFYITEQRRLGNEIDQTLLAITDIDQMTATMKAQNVIRLAALSELDTRIALLNAQAGELNAQAGELNAQAGELNAQVSIINGQAGDIAAERVRLLEERQRILQLIESTDQVIRDLESRPSAA